MWSLKQNKRVWKNWQKVWLGNKNTQASLNFIVYLSIGWRKCKQYASESKLFSREFCVLSSCHEGNEERERVMTTLSGSDWFLTVFTFYFILLQYLNWDFQIYFPMKISFPKSWLDCLTLDWNEKPVLGFWLIHHIVLRWRSCPAGNIQFIVHPSWSGCVMGVALFVLYFSFLLPAWSNSFKCVNDNWGFILIHTSVQCFYQ